MANPTSEYHRGEMDITAQKQTYKLVMGLTKWGSLATAVVVLFPTLWFCTDAGFMGALAASVVLTAAGVVFLRDKPDAH